MARFKNVLLVDDSISSNQYNRILIDGLNIAESIVLKNNADSALDYLKGKESGIYPKPELILLDLAMPQTDGFMFLESYAELPAQVTNNWKIVIAVVSDHAHEENLERLKKFTSKGLLEYIQKPLTTEAIDNLINTHCD